MSVCDLDLDELLKNGRCGIGGLDGDPEGVVAGQEERVIAFAASKASDLARGGEMWVRVGGGGEVVGRDLDESWVARAEGGCARVWRYGVELALADAGGGLVIW